MYNINTVYKIDNLSEDTAQHREPYSKLFGELNGKEIQKGGDVCICMADSLCCTAETNIVKQLFSNKIFRKEEMSYGHEKIGK